MRTFQKWFGVVVLAGVFLGNTALAGEIEFVPDAVVVPATTMEGAGKYVTLKLFNRTGGAVPLVNVKTSCGCLFSRNTPAEIPANGSVDIELEFKAAKRVGAFLVNVVAEGGTGGGVVAAAAVKGLFLPNNGILVEPAELDFGRVYDSQPRERIISITSLVETDSIKVKSSQPLEIEERASSSPINKELGTITRDYRVRIRAVASFQGEVVVEKGAAHTAVPIKVVTVSPDLVIPKIVTVYRKNELQTGVKVLFAQGAVIPKLPEGFLLTPGEATSSAYRQFFLKIDKPELVANGKDRVEVLVSLGERKGTLVINIGR